MLNELRSSSRIERVPLRRAYPLLGSLLALGAPLGLLVLRALQSPGPLGFGWLASELRGDVAGYLYLTCSTAVVLASCGFVLGNNADRMRALMMTDPLTGLFNRRYLDQRLRHEAARIARYGGELSLMVIDVDRLKEINDRLGHETGDRALLAVANALHGGLRATDVAARHGGDEFAVLCPFTSANEARRLAERIRTQLDTELGGKPMTVSIGIADLRAARNSHVEALFDAADRALYRAKTEGRNQVQIAASDPVGDASAAAPSGPAL